MREIELSKKYLWMELFEFNKEYFLELAELLEFHNNLYYNKNTSIISDSEYDELRKKLEKLESTFWFIEDTETVWVKKVESTFQKIEHKRPMLSLDNTYNEEDLLDFDKRIKNILPEFDWKKIEYAIEYKYDGLALSLIYENWELVRGLTRWNGQVWEDVTENVKMITNIPKKIDYKGEYEVRGEVMMLKSTFDFLNNARLKSWENLFANPRNAAAGSLKQKNPEITKDRKLIFLGYDSPISAWEKTHIDKMKFIKNLWLESSGDYIKCDWIEDVVDFVHSFVDKKNSLPYEIDGLVVKVNDISVWEKLGLTAHHPRYAIAYKFPSEMATTKVESVEYSVWRTWTITPVANLTPVLIWWVTVSRATLHNFDEVKLKDVKIWDTVFIKRAWEVIPDVVSPVKEARNWEEEEILPPTFCPICENIVKKDEDKVRYYCDNFFCPIQVKERISYSISKNCLNIDWLWPRVIERFLELWLISDLRDIFKLHLRKNEIISLEWFKEKSVNNLINSIDNARNQKLNIFITSLWIAGIWKQSSKELSKLFKSKEDILYFSYSLEDLEELNDFWPELAKNVYDFFTNEDKLSFVSGLLDNIDVKFDNWELPKTKISWMKFCVTWTFEGVKRNDIVKQIEENGWEFISSVSSKLDYLVAWEKAWSKLEKANKLWITVLSLEDFQKLI